MGKKIKEYAIIDLGRKSVTDIFSTSRGDGKTSMELVSSDAKHPIVSWGNDNYFPQKMKELGRLSGKHGTISERMGNLIAGSGIQISLIDKDKDISAADQKIIDVATQMYKDWCFIDDGAPNKINLHTHICHELYYYHCSPLIFKFNHSSRGVSNKAKSKLISITPAFADRFRTSELTLHDLEWKSKNHYYHRNWGWNPSLDEIDGFVYYNYNSSYNQKVVSISEYQRNYQKNKDNIFFVKAYTKESLSSVQSYLIKQNGIFDGVYPNASWQKSSYLSFIQTDYEFAIMLLDMVKNGLHLSYIVDVYHELYNDPLNDQNDAGLEQFEEDKKTIKEQLKGSGKAGSVVVNPIGTDDENTNGTIKITEIPNTRSNDMLDFVTNTVERQIMAGHLAVVGEIFGLSNTRQGLANQGSFLESGYKIIKNNLMKYTQKAESFYKFLNDNYVPNGDRIKTTIIPNNILFREYQYEILRWFFTDEESRKLLQAPETTQEVKKELKDNREFIITKGEDKIENKDE